MESIYASSQCGSLNRPALAWIVDAEAWQRQYAQVMSLRMTPPPPPVVDFTREGVLLIAMGQQSSGGYALSLSGAPATVENGVLTAPLEWREPPPGYAQTQVMTHPCLLVKLPKAAFSQMRIVDQEGRLRLEGRR